MGEPNDVTVSAQHRRPAPDHPDAPAPRDLALGASPAAFLTLTFLLSWVSWTAAANLPGTAEWSMGARSVLYLPGTFGPAIIALWLTARAGGARAVAAFLSRLFIWNVGLRWYAFALGYMAAIKLSAAVLHRAITGTWPAFGAVPWYLLFAAAIFTAAFQAGEELGWRGYLLRRLAQGSGLAAASVLTGVIWAVWHLPLFFLRGTDLSGTSFPVFLVSVTALSVAMAWLFERTGGSVLLVMLMHAAVNNTTGIVPAGGSAHANPLVPAASLVAWLTMGLLCLAAAFFLLMMRRGSDRLAD